jgi:hypothetical protein
MRKLAIAVALTSTMLATPALARDGAWYVGGSFGPMIVEDIEVDIGAVDNAITIDSEYGYDGELFVGHDFGAFRLEARSLTSALVSMNSSRAFGCRVQARDFAQFSEADGRSEALSFMVNGMLDFRRR